MTDELWMALFFILYALFAYVFVRLIVFIYEGNWKSIEPFKKHIVRIFQGPYR